MCIKSCVSFLVFDLIIVPFRLICPIYSFLDYNQFMKIFGERLRECRLRSKYSQQKLGELLSVSQSTVGKYERGELEPSFDMVVKICRLMEVSADYLFGLSDF